MTESPLLFDIRDYFQSLFMGQMSLLSLVGRIVQLVLVSSEKKSQVLEDPLVHHAYIHSE